MSTVSPITLATTAPGVQRTRAVAPLTRTPNPVVLEPLVIDADARRKGPRRSAKRADGAYQPSSAQTMSSSAVLEALNNLTLGG